MDPGDPRWARVRVAGLLGLWAALVASRVLAMPPAPTEWDPELFVRAVRDFDLVRHQPHPPGYPVLILAARAVDWVVADAHRSLCLVSLAASSGLVIPLYDLLRRGAGFGAADATAAVALMSFSPPYWLRSSEAVSEPLALACLVLAAWTGWRASRAGTRGAGPWLVAAAVALSLAVGARPPAITAALGIAVWIAWSAAAPWRARAVALLAGTAVCAAWLGWMIAQQGSWEAFAGPMLEQTSWFLRHDASIAGARWPPEWTPWIVAWGTSATAWPILTLVAVGLTVMWWRSREVAALLCCWLVPYVAGTVLFQDPAIPRYAMLGLPVLAAAAVLGARTFVGRWAPIVVWSLAVLLAAQAWPVVRLYAREPLPTLQALNWSRAHVGPSHRGVVYEDGMAGFAPRFLEGVPSVDSTTASTRQDLDLDGWLYVRETRWVGREALFQAVWTSAPDERRRFTRGRYHSAFVYAWTGPGEVDSPR